MAYPSTRRLDHIIHLSPPGQLQRGIESFRNLGFNVIPGGQHADGLTSNALIVLSDGVYVELIEFNHTVEDYPPGSVERANRERHWWASKPPGWIDWANQAFDDQISNAINGRNNVRVHYQDPVQGGRTRPDGQSLQWRVTFPGPEHGRGTLPFYCEDLTPRETRVPNDPPSVTQHRQGELCVAYILLTTTSSSFATISQQLSTVLGVSPIPESSTTNIWMLETPSLRSPGPLLRLSISDNTVQVHATIQEIGFRHISPRKLAETTMGEPDNIILRV